MLGQRGERGFGLPGRHLRKHGVHAGTGDTDLVIYFCYGRRKSVLARQQADEPDTRSPSRGRR